MSYIRILLTLFVLFCGSISYAISFNDNSIGIISAFKEDSFPNNPSRSTAFILGDGKYIMTCAHVIKDCSAYYFQPMRVTQLFKLDIYKIFPEMDIAILTLQKEVIFPYKSIPFDESNKEIEIGDNVNIVGWERKEAYFKVEACNIESVIPIKEISMKEDRSFELIKGDRYKIIVFDGPAIPGYSGSPILNEEGEVIGLTIGMSENSNPESGKHINYAILFDASIRKFISVENP